MRAPIPSWSGKLKLFEPLIAGNCCYFASFCSDEVQHFLSPIVSSEGCLDDHLNRSDAGGHAKMRLKTNPCIDLEAESFSHHNPFMPKIY